MFPEGKSFRKIKQPVNIADMSAFFYHIFGSFGRPMHIFVNATKSRIKLCYVHKGLKGKERGQCISGHVCKGSKLCFSLLQDQMKLLPFCQMSSIGSRNSPSTTFQKQTFLAPLKL